MNKLKKHISVKLQGKAPSDKKAMSLQQTLSMSTVKLNTIDECLAHIEKNLFGSYDSQSEIAKYEDNCVSIANEINDRLKVIVERIEKIESVIQNRSMSDEVGNYIENEKAK